MGNICCETDNTDPNAGMSKKMLETDMGEPNLLGKDEIEKIELSLPFARTDIRVFEVKVRAAMEAGEKEGFVSLYMLRNHFKTDAWASI